MNENFDAFDAYVMKYNMEERMIAFKYNHSYRVVHQSEEIARSLKLDEEQKDLASLIGLLHDIARFKQWTEYETFSDFDSFDHGDVGVDILFKDNEIKNYNINKDKYDIISKAIKNHNKRYIKESDMTINEKLHSKIIRDADKIDILYSFSTNRLLEVETDDSPISNKIHEDFMNHTQLDKKDITNKNERTLMLMGLVFDLNYQYSKDRVYTENYINKIYQHISNKNIFKEYVDEINNYLKSECKKK